MNFEYVLYVCTYIYQLNNQPLMEPRSFVTVTGCKLMALERDDVQCIEME